MSCLKSICKKFAPLSKNDNKDIKLVTIEERLKMAKREQTIQILFLGTGSAGKTTIMKQLDKIHNKSHNDDFRIMRTREHIQVKVPQYMKTLCWQYEKLSQKRNNKNVKLFQNYYYDRNRKLIIGYLRNIENEYDKLLIPLELKPLIFIYYHIDNKNEELRAEFLQISYPYKFEDGRLATQISTLWSDKRIKETLKLRSNYQIDDNVEYFLNRTEEICTDDYEPTFEDYIRFRERSTGFSMTRIETNFHEFGQYIFEVIDAAGFRSERRKWMRFLSEELSCIIYVIAISEYDLKIFEDNKTNRLVEGINLFRKIVEKFNQRHAKNILIFLNKYDLFKEKIKTIPITVAFSDFDGNPYDETEALHFVENKLLECFKDNNIQLDYPLHFYRTNALDTNNVKEIFPEIMYRLAKNCYLQHRIM